MHRTEYIRTAIFRLTIDLCAIWSESHLLSLYCGIPIQKFETQLLEPFFFSPRMQTWFFKNRQRRSHSHCLINRYSEYNPIYQRIYIFIKTPYCSLIALAPAFTFLLGKWEIHSFLARSRSLTHRNDADHGVRAYRLQWYNETIDCGELNGIVRTASNQVPRFVENFLKLHTSNYIGFSWNVA